MEGHIDFESQPWPSISSSAKDLVRRMLTADPKRRISAADVLRKYLLKTFYGATTQCKVLEDSIIGSFLILRFALLFCAEHPWLREGGEASDKPIDSAVLSRMKQFRAMNKLKKLALKVKSRFFTYAM